MGFFLSHFTLDAAQVLQLSLSFFFVCCFELASWPGPDCAMVVVASLYLRIGCGETEEDGETWRFETQVNPMAF